MRISITFAILLLSLSIMSYGLTGAVSAQSNVPPISVATDFPAYGETGLIGISGHVKESIISEFPMPVIIKVQKEDGSLVAIAQVDVDRDGDFSTSVTPGGQMSTAGEYTVTAIYNKNEAQSIFTYSGGSGGSVPAPAPAPEPTPEPVPEPTPEPVPEPTPEPTPVVEPEPEPEPEPQLPLKHL